MSDMNIEIRDRLRRIETRLTAFIAWSGFDAKVQQPTFNGDRVQIPSLDVRLSDIIRVREIPRGRAGPIKLYIRDSYVGTLTFP